MRHVGDVHSHLPEAVAETAYRQGVVEVLGVVRVDGAREDLPEVLPALEVFVGYLGRNLLGGVLHGLGVLVGQSVLCEDRVHLDVVVALLAEHIDHFAHGVLMLRVGPLLYPDHGFLPRLSPLQLPFGYEDVGNEDGFGRDEERHVFLYPQAAHKRVARPLQNGRHHGLAHVVLAARQECGLHAVAVEGAHGVALGHEDRLRAVVGNEAVFAVGLAPEPSLLHLRLGVEPVRVVAYLGQIVIP